MGRTLKRASESRFVLSCKTFRVSLDINNIPLSLRDCIVYEAGYFRRKILVTQVEKSLFIRRF